MVSVGHPYHRHSKTIVDVHIADGFVDDCEELMRRCFQADILNFHIFSNIFKDMNFAHIFQGRTSVAELVQFTEECIHIAKRYMLGKSTNIEESVVGLFLVYSLVQLQPFPGFTPLRLTPDDVEAIVLLEEVARKQKRHDVLYILGHLLIEGPCELHIADRDYGLESNLKKNFLETTSVDKMQIAARGVFYRQNEELDILRELASLTRRYTNIKSAIHGRSQLDRTLSYTDDHMPSELAASLKQLVQGASVDKDDKTEGEMIQSIKQRAMKDTVNQMRHLSSINDKSPEKVKKSPKTDTVKIETPKRSPKKVSPKKNTVVKQCKDESKIGTKKNLLKPQKRKRPISSSDSDQNDDEISLASSDSLDSEEEDLKTVEYLNNLKTIDEYLTESQKLRKNKEIEKEQRKSKVVEQSAKKDKNLPTKTVENVQSKEGTSKEKNLPKKVVKAVASQKEVSKEDLTVSRPVKMYTRKKANTEQK